MEQQVQVGKKSDSMEHLTELCKEKASQMAATMTDEAQVSFWTSDKTELICIATFSRKTDGEMGFDLDFSQSTL